MATAVKGIGVSPIAADGLLAVKEDEVDRVALRRMFTQVLPEGDQQGRGAGTIVGTDKICVAQVVIGFVVRGKHDDAVALARELDDEVVHRLRAGGGVREEAVDDEVTLGGLGSEVILDEGFGGGVARGAVEAFGGGGEHPLREVEDVLAGDALGGGVGLWCKET